MTRSPERHTVSDRLAREALADGGTVVECRDWSGCGEPATPAPPCDSGRPEHRAPRGIRAPPAAAGLEHSEVTGTWPDIAAITSIVDVVMCHHLVYNVADLQTFASALDAHAGRRVPIELAEHQPMAWMTALLGGASRHRAT